MMFANAAWTRLTTTTTTVVIPFILLLLLFTTPAHAHEDRLFTDSVTYCAPPSAILVQNFEIQYTRKNQSVGFNIDAASVKENLNVTANIMLNVYGMNSLNLTFDFCSIAPRIGCPLPTFNFNGSADIPLDFYSYLGILDVQNRIPSIAYVVPDIEAFAQFTLRNVENGEIVACVQATLSNGWSMRQSRATTTTIIVVCIAFFAALFQQRLQASRSPLHTSSSPSYSTQRLVDLLHFLQHIVITGFLNVNYPPCLSLICQQLRRTGSPTAANETALDAVGWTNRKSSPYNYNYTTYSLDAPRFNVALAVPAVVTQAEEDALPAGIPTIVNSLDIPTQNAFMTLFFTLLFALCLAITFFGLLYLALWATRKLLKERTPSWVELMLDDYVFVVKAQGVILAFIALLPVMTLAFFQWSIKDSWLAIFLAVLTFLGVVTGVLYPLVTIFRASRASQADPLQLQCTPALVHALPLFGSYRAQRWSFSDLTVLSFFIKALVVVAGKKHGYFQVVFLIVIEFLHLVALLVARPFKSRGGDVFATFLAIIRMVTMALVVPFVASLEIKAIPRAALGLGSAVVSSATVVVLFFSILINALWGTFQMPQWLCCCRRRPREATRESDRTSVVDEKTGDSIDSPASSSARSGAASDSSATVRNDPSTEKKTDQPDDEDANEWRPWTPTPSARQVIQDLPPRPGPPEPASRFTTPAREIELGEYDVELANQLSPIGALPSGLDLDSPMPYTPSGSFIGSRASVSSYGCPVAPERRGSWTYAGDGRPASGGSWIPPQTGQNSAVGTPMMSAHASFYSAVTSEGKLQTVEEHGPVEDTSKR
ncbi:TRP-domain-containing protein [Auriculariales sp. MPI-PUGE-AT-0066]|nr:TRP-domain-containing protein [Auriculariales sp. MPI-PUGE-AT-0066]